MLNNQIGRIVTLTLTTVIASICQGKTGPEVQFLNTYDQLSSVIGQEGHWFVRDAANTKTGQHGDPTVEKGWAMYTWDTTLGYFRKICEEESMDNNVSEALLRQYVKTSTFEATIAQLNSKFVTTEDHNRSVQTLNDAINMNKSNITKLESTVNGMKTTVQSADENAQYAKQQVQIVKQMVIDLDVETVRAQLYAMSNKVEKASTGIGEITNLVHSIDGRVSALEVKIGDQSRIIAATTNSVKVIETALNELKQEMITRDDEILRLAKAYTDEKTAGGGGGGGVDTNAVKDIVHKEIPNYGSVSNAAMRARGYYDFDVLPGSWEPSTNGNFNASEWIGKNYIYDNTSNITNEFDEKLSYAGETTFQGRQVGMWNFYYKEPESDIWVLDTWAKMYGEYVDGKHKFTITFDEEVQHITVVEGFKFRVEFNYHIDEDEYGCIFDMQAILGNDKKDKIALKSDLDTLVSRKRDYLDLMYIKPTPFDPSPYGNFGANYWSGSVTIENVKITIKAEWIPANTPLESSKSLKATSDSGKWKVYGYDDTTKEWYDIGIVFDGIYENDQYKFTLYERETTASWVGFKFVGDVVPSDGAPVEHYVLEASATDPFDRIALLSDLDGASSSRWRRISEIQKPVKEIVTVNQIYDILMRIIDIAGEEPLSSPNANGNKP